jgi:hypothetical protein
MYQNKYVLNSFVSLIGALSLVSCTKGGSDFSSLESTVGADNIPCKIAEKLPVADSLKASSTAGTKTLFSVVPSTSSCKIFYFVNNVKINTASSPVIEIDSAILNAGDNNIRVEASNDLGSDTKSWVLKKNALPTCSRAVPTASSFNIINSSSLSFRCRIRCET